jgi:hypothetical protein
MAQEEMRPRPKPGSTGKNASRNGWHSLLYERWWIALSAIVGIFLISQISLLASPGMQQDEAVWITPAMEFAHGREITYGGSITFMGIHYPTMIGAYMGNSLTIPVAIVVCLFGFHLTLVRFIWVVAGAATIVFVFLLCRELFNPQVGLLASLLLAINPSFWMFTHVGSYCSANLTLDITASLFFFLIFYRRRRGVYLFLAMLFFGHGIFTRIAFGYFMIAYGASFAYLWLRRRIDRNVMSLKNGLIAVPAFLLGSWPLLYNLFASADTLVSIRAALIGTSAAGIRNAMIWRNLLTRFWQTRDFLLEGSAPADAMVTGSGAHNILMPYVFIICFVVLVVMIAKPGFLIFARESIAFLLVVFCVYQFLIVFTPTALNEAVYAYIPPFVAIIVALAFYIVYSTSREVGASIARWVALTAIVLAVSSEVYVLCSQYAAIHSTGGSGLWSRSVFQLNAYLLEHTDRQPVALDWGLDYPIYTLSDLRIKPTTAYEPFTRVAETGWVQLWDKEPPPDYADTIKDLIKDSKNIYLARPEGWAQFKGRLKVLQKVVKGSGAELHKIFTIYDSNAEVWIDIYEVWRPATRVLMGECPGGIRRFLARCYS